MLGFFKKIFNRNKKQLFAQELLDNVAQGDRQALLEYISICHHHKIKLDYELFQKGLITSAENGDPTSMFELGNFYAKGTLKFEHSHQKAFEWYLKAAEYEHSNAMNKIAFCYFNGFGVEQDYIKTKEWYLKSAALDNSHAMANLGSMYLGGKGVEQDYETAKEWYFKAIELNNANAMNNIAYMYDEGLGFEKDHEKAKEWFDKSKAIKQAEEQKEKTEAEVKL